MGRLRIEENMNVPNKITLSRFVITIILAIIFVSDGLQMPVKNYTLTGIFLLGAITDVLDGFIARRFNQITTLGIFMDPIADKVLILTSMVCLVYLHRLSPVIAIVLLGRDLIMTGLRLIASEQGVVIPALVSGKIKVVLETILIAYLFLDFDIFAFELVLIILSIVFAYFSLIKAIIKNANILRQDNKRI